LLERPALLDEPHRRGGSVPGGLGGALLGHLLKLLESQPSSRDQQHCDQSCARAIHGFIAALSGQTKETIGRDSGGLMRAV
jgi:hypothetical protein